MSAAELEELRRTVDRHSALLATIVNYLESDLETAKLEGRRLDANTAELELLSSRVRVLELARSRGNANANRDDLSRRIAALELRGDNHLRYLDSLQEQHDRLAGLAAGRDNDDHSRAAR